MPTAEHERIVAAPFAEVWAFVREMDNWAPLVTGYQRHEKRSDADSFWLLKGELGGLTRIAEFNVHIDEWDESGRVRFSLQGVNEPITGSGNFVAQSIAAERIGSRVSEVTTSPPGPLTRFRNAIARRILALLFGRRKGEEAVKPSQGGEQCRLFFALTLNASGAAGLVMNMMLTPMMAPIAEDLANRIAERIER